MFCPTGDELNIVYVSHGGVRLCIAHRGSTHIDAREMSGVSSEGQTQGTDSAADFYNVVFRSGVEPLECGIT